jgi:hypothetical protein
MSTGRWCDSTMGSCTSRTLPGLCLRVDRVVVNDYGIMNATLCTVCHHLYIHLVGLHGWAEIVCLVCTGRQLRTASSVIQQASSSYDRDAGEKSLAHGRVPPSRRPQSLTSSGTRRRSNRESFSYIDLLGPFTIVMKCRIASGARPLFDISYERPDFSETRRCRCNLAMGRSL